MQYLIICIACELVIPCGFIFNKIMKSHLNHSLWLICETNATEKNQNNDCAIQLHKIYCNNQKIMLSSS